MPGCDAGTIRAAADAARGADSVHAAVIGSAKAMGVSIDGLYTDILGRTLDVAADAADARREEASEEARRLAGLVRSAPLELGELAEKLAERYGIDQCRPAWTVATRDALAAEIVRICSAPATEPAMRSGEAAAPIGEDGCRSILGAYAGLVEASARIGGADGAPRVEAAMEAVGNAIVAMMGGCGR